MRRSLRAGVEDVDPGTAAAPWVTAVADGSVRYWHATSLVAAVVE
ncbi:hypothetical protein YT1_0618 [Rhodococcus ruber]|nr:hypothetical protein YT1_0618 [Rhodococcus ruber]